MPEWWEQSWPAAWARRVQTARDLVENLAFELGATGRWLLRFELPESPAIGQHRGHALFQLDHVHRLQGLSFSVGRGICEQHGGEVGGGLGGVLREPWGR